MPATLVLSHRVAHRAQSFAPVADPDAHVLILGSLPGVASLQQGQYYAHPRNHFWRLLGDILHQNLVSMPYAARLQTLRAHHIALWDVVADATRKGSLDSHIHLHASNDLIALIATLPKLRMIAFNGATAERIGLKILRQASPHCVRLPSSSPAHAVPYTEKLAAWRALSGYIATPHPLDV